MSAQAGKPTIRYEDAAERVTVEGWACLTCRRWYGEDERAARWCCATDLPCECGGRREKTYTCCDSCRDRKYAERWAARERREWKGEPLFSETLERFIFDSDDLEEALEDTEGGAESLHLVFCRPAMMSIIEDDQWFDELPEDCGLDDAAPDIAKAIDGVNELILQRKEPLSWLPGEVAAIIPPDEGRGSEGSKP